MGDQGFEPPHPADEPKPPAPGQVAREEVFSRELAMKAETATSAVAAQAVEAVRARYVMAMQRPRQWPQVRVSLLEECRRPAFARVARYHKPVGDGIEGPSIRFAEAALRCMGNMLPECFSVYDDAQKRIVRVSLTDLETNLTYTKDVVITKTVERSKLQEGQRPLSQRRNSRGRLVYVVEATDDDILNKENALVSKALRTLVLRFVPGDLLDECMAIVIEIVEKGITADPDAEQKRIADAFASLRVSPAMLAEYLGHDIATCSPAELVKLRGIYAAIKDGEASWAEVVGAVGGDDPGPKTDGEKPQSSAQIESLREKLEAKKKRGAAPAPSITATERADASASAGGAGASTTKAPADAQQFAIYLWGACLRRAEALKASDKTGTAQKVLALVLERYDATMSDQVPDEKHAEAIEAAASMRDPDAPIVPAAQQQPKEPPADESPFDPKTKLCRGCSRHEQIVAEQREANRPGHKKDCPYGDR